MPSADLLAGPSAISNAHVTIAVLWHLLLAATLGASTLGWAPSPRLARSILALQPISVSTLAFLAWQSVQRHRAWSPGNPALAAHR